MYEFIVEYLDTENIISEIKINASSINRAIEDAEVKLGLGLNDDVKEIISVKKVLDDIYFKNWT